MDLVLNLLMKFITRTPNVKGYVSRQLAKISSYSCFSLDKRPHLYGGARYRLQMENPETQYCYLNSSKLKKSLNTSVSERMDGSDQIQCIIEKQVREADPGQVYKLQTKRDGKSDDNS